MAGSLHLQEPIQNSSSTSSTGIGQRSINNLVPPSIKDVHTELKPKAATRNNISTTLRPMAVTGVTATPISIRYKYICTDMASGWFGGAIGIAVTHPLDCIRVMKQYQARISNTNLSYLEILKRIRNIHGMTGFYRGVLPPSVLRGIGLAANRAGYSFGMQLFKEEKVRGTWRIWVVGGLAGSCTGVVDMPINLLKCRAQVKLGRTKECFSLYTEMLRRIWIYEGFGAFTNGLVPQLLCCVITYGAFYAMYDTMICYDFSVPVAGMVAGSMSWPIGLPLDSLRVRMQCQPYDVPFRTALGEMWRQPIHLWFSGMGMTMLRAAPRWGFTMLAIETCNEVLKDNF